MLSATLMGRKPKSNPKPCFVQFGSPGGIRTHTAVVLSDVTPAGWSTGPSDLEPLAGVEPAQRAYQARLTTASQGHLVSLEGVEPSPAASETAMQNPLHYRDAEMLYELTSRARMSP